MSKTIESKLREIKRKEQKLENQRKKLEQRRNQLEIEKHQEEVHHKKYEPYLEQFKELDLQFEYKQGNITIKPLDFENDEYLSFIHIKESKETKHILNKLLQDIHFGRMVEKHTKFKMSDFNNKMEFKVQNGEYWYILNINIVKDNYTINIIKENWDDDYMYSKHITKHLEIIIESSGYDGFKVSWEYNASATKENIIQQIDTAMEVLTQC